MPRTLRIASLLPSATEIVCALGLRDALVGVSHECDWPPQVVGLPVLTRARLAPPSAAGSGAIDQEIRDALRDALSIYEVDLEALRAAAPDVVITQDLCEVCAVSRDDVVGALREAGLADARVVSLRPERLEDVWEDVRRVAVATGVPSAADAVLARLLARVDAVRERASAASANAAEPHVLTLEWLEPPMVGGLWMPELIALAGGVPLLAAPGQRAPTIPAHALERLSPRPDVVLLKPCGYPLAQTQAELPRIRRLLATRPWPAVRDGRVFAADGSAYFNRPGPRLVDSLELLAGLLHPRAFADHAERYAPAWTTIDLGA